jgi:hypothetical protein
MVVTVTTSSELQLTSTEAALLGRPIMHPAQHATHIFLFQLS